MATIDEYIAGYPEAVGKRLEAIRAVAHKAIPEVVEAVKWNQPAFTHPDGMILVMVSAHKHQINVVVTPSALQANADNFEDFALGKGSVKIPHDVEVPLDRLEKLMVWRYREYTESGVKWM